MIKPYRYSSVFTQVSFILAVLLSACNTPKNALEPAKKPFYGTIVYDVAIEPLVKSDTSLLRTKRNTFGNEMILTFYENGNIFRRYNGAQPDGFSEYYVDISQNRILEHSIKQDTTLMFSANQENARKLNGLRLSKDTLTILGYTCKEIGIAAEEVDLISHEKKYLTLNYWYSNQIKVDKHRYSAVTADLWSFLFNESDGGIFLKYEKNYFDYKVIYTAKEIRKKDFLEEENLGNDFLQSNY